MYKYTYNRDVGIEWNPAKRLDNLAKHNVDFSDCESVFSAPHALTHEDLEYGEERFVTLEMDDPVRLLVIAYTWRGDNIRIISARKAECSERKYYPKT
uniref:Uncharacterized protein n=1 Tax=Candidatus Kentrum sp. FW TaxID=2126338 RepID=A0A450STG2_9GAMM|nr:MAG: hypothetical protein BECKFW1821A_GA0114235_106919 [Candidatus Kentron sp. FW]